MHVPLIMQQLFIEPLLILTVAAEMGVIMAPDVSQYMPFDVQCWFSVSFTRTVLWSELGPGQPLLQREPVWEEREDGKS